MTSPRSRDQVEADQLHKLRSMIAQLSDNPFYSAKLNATGLHNGPASIDDFRTRMPFTTKEELVHDQQQNPPYGTNLTFPLVRYSRFSQTSATSGQPLVWLDTEDGWQWMLDCWKLVYRAVAVSSKDRIYFAFSFGPFLGFWTAFEAALQLRCLCIPGGGHSSVARLKTLVEHRATVLCCTPTYAIHLGATAQQQNIDLSTAEVRAIIVAGEPGGSVTATRQQIERLWPTARVFDHHGMTETGPVSYPNPKLPDILHVNETAYIAEIIDPDTTEPAKPGDLGELVLTNLGRTGSPLLRYRSGDLVRSDPNAAPVTGRADLGLKGGILGRIDDMVIVRGVNIFPSAVDDIVRRFDEVSEYRVTVDSQQTMPELAIQIELAPSCGQGANLVTMLEEELRTAFSLRIPVTIADANSLPRFELKAKRWVLDHTSLNG